MALAGGGHGTYIPAAVFFPFSMIVAEHAGTIGMIPLCMAAVQFPAYALVMARHKKGIYYPIFAAHLIAVAIAILNRGDRW